MRRKFIIFPTLLKIIPYLCGLMEKFEDLGLSPALVNAVGEMGFIHPTPIQSQAIPRLLEEELDFVGLAQTGTGKTAAFGLPLIDRVDPSLPFVQALVIVPTRELCLQVSGELEQFAQFSASMSILPVYGGADIGRQIRRLKSGVHILVATPGRLRDLMRRRAADIRQVRYVILDEADEMLNMGFKEEIDEILDETPEEKNTWLFSATMPREIRRIADTYMEEPFELSIGTKNTANEDIEHQYVIVRPKERYEVLRRFLEFEQDAFVLVFCRTRRDTGELADQLQKDGYSADALHGELSQAQRDSVMGRFRTKHVRILVATDVAARGIDVDDITHVFHFNIPDDINFYTHRSGRTGRAGNKGISLVLAHPKDDYLIRRLEKKLKTNFVRARIPSGREVLEKRIEAYLKRVEDFQPEEEAVDLLGPLIEQFDPLSYRDLILRLSALALEEPINAYVRQRKMSTDKKDRNSSQSGKGLFINIGSMDVDGKGGLLSLICGQSNIPGSAIGKINLQTRHSIFFVEEEYAARVMNSFRNFSFEGREIRVNPDDASNRGKRKDKKGKKGKTGKKKKYKKSFRK
jgi:ATP-dependent RNA helicase DeaD